MSRLKEKRLELGISRAEASRKTGIPLRTLENYESEERKCPTWVENLIIEKWERVKAEEEAKMSRYEKSIFAVGTIEGQFKVKEGMDIFQEVIGQDNWDEVTYGYSLDEQEAKEKAEAIGTTEVYRSDIGRIINVNVAIVSELYFSTAEQYAEALTEIIENGVKADIFFSDIETFSHVVRNKNADELGFMLE